MTQRDRIAAAMMSPYDSFRQRTDNIEDRRSGEPVLSQFDYAFGALPVMLDPQHPVAVPTTPMSRALGSDDLDDRMMKKR